MSLYHNTKQKIRNVQRTIDALLDGDFPIDSGRRALFKLKRVFEALEKRVDRAFKLKDTLSLSEIANDTNLKVFETLPILGFIVRSTNVRNAFELIDPLQDIANRALQGKPELLLSSEWDYVPFAYPQSLSDLASFVMIGMPASETGSALLSPLAGHELGHAVWRNRGVEGSVHSTLQFKCQELYENTKDAFKKAFPEYREDDLEYKELYPDAIASSLDFAIFQAEEIFCDLFAYAIFGEAYLHAFSYILAPGSGGLRKSKYPSYKTRISAIRGVAANEGVTLPGDDILSFHQERERPDPRERFILEKAEQVVSGIVAALWSYILKILEDGTVPRPLVSRYEVHLNEFRNKIPAHSPNCLGDIINAGWRYYQELQSAEEPPENIAEEMDALNEILLKSVEVLEFRRRTET
ncbi:hypothetical protein ACNHKD_10000 [Methylocystis sp. JAN1]|uniref:hypothetical protein n=1 Tax=Methylocystis sp. JAN1 TaxID=3397211 RepID=UPI003FA23939